MVCPYSSCHLIGYLIVLWPWLLILRHPYMTNCVVDMGHPWQIRYLTQSCALHRAIGWWHWPSHTCEFLRQSSVGISILGLCIPLCSSHYSTRSRTQGCNWWVISDLPFEKKWWQNSVAFSFSWVRWITEGICCVQHLSDHLGVPPFWSVVPFFFRIWKSQGEATQGWHQGQTTTHGGSEGKGRDRTWLAWA